MSHKQRLLERINNREAHISVVGLGYVGLPLAVAFAEAGFHVTALDIDSQKIERLKQGQSYIDDVTDAQLQAVLAAERFSPTVDYAALAEVDSVSICVQTPLNDKREPDLSSVQSVLGSLREVLHDGMLVILESTTYPGTTEEVVQPALVDEHYTIGNNLFVAFSGERLDPGNKTYQIHNTPKVIGGITQHSTDVTVALYETIIEQVVPVSSPTAAEMVKLLENTFRSVNIALANEMALACAALGLNVWEIIQAAATKPFGFMPFYPGPGVGGHCIPIDPHYLNWKLKTLNSSSRFIDLAETINNAMPQHVVTQIADALNDQAKSVRGSRILALGVAYKPNIDDMRESPALYVIDLLREKGADVVYHDPHVPELRLEDGQVMRSSPYSQELLAEADCVVILTNHASYNWAEIAHHSRVIVDTRNALAEQADVGKIIGL